MYESRTSPLASRQRFIRRMIWSAVYGCAIIVASLFVGMLGYHYLEAEPWIDAFANAAMILSGMGPLGELHSDAGKIFAGVYALYSGLALILITGIVFAPVVHRFLHRFHLEEKARAKDE